MRRKDYVGIPFSKEDFDRLSGWRRFLERICRTPFGNGPYYFFVLWLLWVLLASFRLEDIRRPAQRFDILPTGVCAFVWAGTTICVAHFVSRDPLIAVFYGVLLPFLVWSKLFGLTLYLQHTDLSARFFRDRSEWEFFSSQLSSATNIEFPKFLELSPHGIFEYSAHHLYTSIPFYELHDPPLAQTRGCVLQSRQRHSANH